MCDNEYKNDIKLLNELPENLKEYKPEFENIILKKALKEASDTIRNLIVQRNNLNERITVLERENRELKITDNILEDFFKANFVQDSGSDIPVSSKTIKSYWADYLRGQSKSIHKIFTIADVLIYFKHKCINKGTINEFWGIKERQDEDTTTSVAKIEVLPAVGGGQN
jgi:hypothetical protein